MTTRIEIIEPLRAREIADISDIRKLADWLDTRFVIPGTNLRFGLDSVIGLVPGVGDGVTALMSLYIMHRARELGAPPLLLARMGGNVVLDTLLGAVPLLGDVFDFAFRSNTRNLRLLLRHLEKQGHVVRLQPSPHKSLVQRGRCSHANSNRNACSTLGTGP